MAKSENRNFIYRYDILRDASIYTTGVYFIQIIVFGLGLFTKKFLGPTNLGIWNIFIIIISYLSYVDLGISDASAREIPYWISRKNSERSKKFTDLMYTYNLISGIILGIGAIVYALIFINRITSKEYFIGLLILGFLFPMTRWIACSTIHFRSLKQFVLLSKTTVIVMVIYGILSLLFAWRYELYGLYAAYFIQIVINTLLWKQLNSWKPFYRFYFSTVYFRYLLKIGFPIALAGFTFTVFRTIDSVITYRYLGETSFGIYSIGVSLTTFIFTLPNSLSIIMYPRFQERFGESKDNIESLIPFIIKPTIVLASFVLPLIIGMAYIIGPFLIRIILPEFITGIPSLKILLLGIYFLSLTHMAGQFMITINRQILSVLITVLATIFTYILLIITLQYGFSLVGVAWSTSFGYLLFTIVLFVYVFNLVKQQKILWQLTKQIGLIVCAMFITLYTADLFFDNSIGNWSQDLARTSFKLLTYLAIYIILIFYMNKKTKVGSEIWEVIKSKICK
jgi:O-antigen/teichoic acid export membrane protein